MLHCCVYSRAVWLRQLTQSQITQTERRPIADSHCTEQNGPERQLQKQNLFF